ncbi:serine/threonine-protein kinase dst2-like [Chiloscyllium plagiosum]|uniref:serine/threonine-protein kinase dst2-like n=1 Tax=Chiloscyllium plagiosum TaxID=36176 RepID=UPI001CB7F0C6|nr:serine/threonine-protein kinase dst2-like [Chiloscyllium plagiosum]
MSMRDRLEMKANELVEEFKQQLEVGEEPRESEVTVLDNLLKKDTENFCKAYTTNYNWAIGKLRQTLLKGFECFIKEQEIDDDNFNEILKTSPMSMRDRLETKANELVEEFKQQLEVGEEPREGEVTELDNLLKKETENFCKAYTTNYNWAIGILRQTLLKGFECFIKEQEVGDDDISVILKTSLMSMRNRLETKANELKGEFKQQLEVGEEQRESEVTELDNLLKKDTENFCKAYTTKYNWAIGNLRQMLLKGFECFIKEQEIDDDDDDDDDISEILKTSPMSMRDRLETKANELVEEFKQQLEVNDLELNKSLKKETEKFCKAYTKQFNRAIGKLMEQMLKQFEHFTKQQHRGNEDIMVRLKTTPASMRKCLDKKACELIRDFQSHLLLSEGESEKEVTELKEHLNEMIENFCISHGNTFTSAIEKLRQEKLKEFESFINQQQQDNKDILKNTPASMRKCLDKKACELIRDFQSHLLQSEGESEKEVTELKEHLTDKIEKFYRLYRNTFASAIEKLRQEKLKEFESFINQQEIDYDEMKKGIRSTFGLVPEANRQMFQNRTRQPEQANITNFTCVPYFLTF